MFIQKALGGFGESYRKAFAGQPSSDPSQNYIDQWKQWNSDKTLNPGGVSNAASPAFPFALPQTPDLTDDAVKQARMSQLGSVGQGRRSTFLDGGISGPPSSGKSFLGG